MASINEKIFGFKHTLTNVRTYDPNETAAARYRLFGRVIRVIGMSQISNLQPFLQANLEKTAIEEIDSPSTLDGIALYAPSSVAL